MANSTSSSPSPSIPQPILDEVKATTRDNPESLAPTLRHLEAAHDRIIDALSASVADAFQESDDVGLTVLFAVFAEFPFYTADHGYRAAHDFAPYTTLYGIECVRDLALGIDANGLDRMPYADYLATHHWQYVRERALDRAGHRCQLCGHTTSLQVHHNSYRHRGDERPEDLLVLCAVCHQHFHDRLEVQR